MGVNKQRQEYLEMASQGDSKQQERRTKSTSFQEDSLSTKIKQFFSPTHLPSGPGSPPVPPVQYKSYHQSSVKPVNRRKVVSAIILSESKNNLSPTSLHPLNPRPSPHPSAGSSPRPSPGSSPRLSPGSSPRPSPSSSPRPPRPPRPPPYKSASPVLSNIASPSPPSIPARSTISKKCDFKNDTGIYVCPISPVNGGSSGARKISSSQSPIKKEAVNNLPPFGQKASPMVMSSQQDGMLVKKGNSVSQLNEHGIPVKLHNTDATSTGTTKGALVPFDDPVYEFAKEDEDDGYEYVKVDNSASGDGYLMILKSSSADDVKDDDDPDDEYDYEYVAVDNFLRETKNDERNKEGAGTSKDDYEDIIHYRQLSV